jgi:putative SOS response-associated peptidase YedK
MITTNANPMMAELHDRMPVILEPQDWSAWLGEVEVDAATLLQPAGGDVLKVWPVSRQVNSSRNNGADLVEAIGQG